MALERFDWLQNLLRQNLLRQRDIKAALPKLRCENDTLSPQIPPLILLSDAVCFFLQKIIRDQPLTHKGTLKEGKGEEK